MSILLSANKLTKNVGSTSLFEDLSFGVFEKEKIGLIGPNGAGKSTLLKILSGLDQADEGEVSTKKHLNVAYVAQTENFPAQQIVLKTCIQSLKESKSTISQEEAEILAATYLSLTGFSKTDQRVEELSGGWLKRLAIAIALAKEPELLLLDEPTNHMDWDGVLSVSYTHLTLPTTPYV